EQFLDRERLVKDRAEAAAQHLRRAMGHPRHEDDLERRVLFFRGARIVEPVRAGQHDIGQQEIDLPAVLGDHEACMVRVLRRENGVALLAQRTIDKREYIRIVFQYQYDHWGVTTNIVREEYAMRLNRKEFLGLVGRGAAASVAAASVSNGAQAQAQAVVN